jgi:ubiquinone/menaquinone biosynthesis C-methylase UbiE
MKKGVRVLIALQMVLVALGSLIFFWLVPLKVIYRILLQLGRKGPSPSAVPWLMDNPIRRSYARPVLDRTGILPGETVLEIGPAPGVLTVAAAERVGPKGKLIVVEERPQMIAQVEARVREARLQNVETHVGSANDLPLEDESIDRVFLITVLPEIPHEYGALDEIQRVLKPGGLLSITEEFTDPDYSFPFETVQLVESAGFSRERYYGNFWNYTLNFGKSRGIAYD